MPGDHIPEPSKEAQIVILLREEFGFNSTQIRHICFKVLKLERTFTMYNKINYLVKYIEVKDAERKFRCQKIKEKLEKRGLI
jgi:hypothetical protein